MLSCSVVSDSWTLDHLAPQSMGFPRQEYWSGLPFTPAGDLPDPGIKPPFPVAPLATPVVSLLLSPWGSPLIHGSDIYTESTCVYLFLISNVS